MPDSSAAGGRCPACGRPLAVARPRCLYCNAVLPSGIVPPSTAGAKAEATPAPPRSYLLYEAAGAPEALAAALRISPAEAQQRCLKGGFHLGGILPSAEAEGERRRLEGEGVRAVALAEQRVAEASRPLAALKGDPAVGVFWFEGASGPAQIQPGDPFLVVRGPVAREYLPGGERQRVRTATLEQGYLIHIHRRSEPRPIELDAATFTFVGRVDPYRSTLLRLLEDVGLLCAGALVDTAFDRESPALAAPEPSRTDAFALTLGLKSSGGAGAQVLDNKAQFRFYSAWHSVLERLREG